MSAAPATRSRGPLADMHSLFLRIFVLFWIAMALIVGGSIAITFAVAAHEYESQDAPRRPNIALQASAVLANGGIAALRRWLKANEHSIPDREIYIIGPDGRDLLGRRLSEGAARRLEFFNRELGPPPAGGPPPPGNFRPPRVAPQIVAPDGSAYTVLLVPRRPSIFGVLSLPGISLTILCHRARRQRLRQLVAGAAPERSDPTHPGGRTRACHREPRGAASAPAWRTARMNSRCSPGISTRWRISCVPTARAITQLLRDISHELRSPLARMRLAVGLARQPPADLPRQLDRLEREIERLDSLISQVLKLARLHGSEAPFEREAFDVDEVIEEVVRDANFEGAVKGCNVELQGTASSTVHGNRELLRSAIENVLRNAVRYSPQGARVDVSVERGDGGAFDRDSRSRARGAGQRPGAHIRAVLSCGGIARSRHRR